MRLSSLQRYLLLEGYVQKRRLTKAHVLRYYESFVNPPSVKDQHGAVDKSIERLIQQGLARAHGTKTQEKWVIEQVSLTREGRAVAGEILKMRGRLPLPRQRKKVDGV